MIKAKRGVYKAFRNYLNTLHADIKHYHRSGPGGPTYHQRTRAYGDYLFSQDRVMFDDCLERAMSGDPKEFAEFHDWDYKAWLA